MRVVLSYLTSTTGQISKTIHSGFASATVVLSYLAVLLLLINIAST